MKNRSVKIFVLKLAVILLAHCIFTAAAYFIGNMLGTFEFNNAERSELITRTLVCALSGAGFLAYMGYKTRKYKQRLDEVTYADSVKYAVVDTAVYVVFTLPIPVILMMSELMTGAAVNRIYAPQLWLYYVGGELLPVKIPVLVSYIVAALIYFTVQLLTYKLTTPVSQSEPEIAGFTSDDTEADDDIDTENDDDIDDDSSDCDNDIDETDDDSDDSDTDDD